MNHRIPPDGAAKTRATTEMAKALSKLGTTNPAKKITPPRQLAQSALAKQSTNEDTPKTAAKSSFAAKAPRPKLLVVGYSAVPGRSDNFGGRVEIYSDVQFDTKWVLMPHVPLTPQGDLIQELFFENATSEVFRNLFCVGYQRLTANIYKRTPAMLLESLFLREMADGLREMQFKREKEQRDAAEAAVEQAGAL